jgi:hypothetical protein
MIRILTGVLAVLLIVPQAGAQGSARRERQRDSSFRWTGTIPEGQWLRVRNLNGEITVEAASGNQVEVTAVKSWRRGDSADVRFETQKDGGSVTICAIWFDATCDEDGYHSDRRRDRDDEDRNSDVSVDFRVRLPRGVKILVSTVNGGLDIRGARAEVDAHTVNGSIDASTSAGPINARTVNGTITARMTTLPSTDDMEFATVNGDITVEVPASFDANVRMTTVNGKLSSDFPLTVSGRMSPQRLRATIGKGGRELSFHTVNGSVELRRVD